MAEGSEEEEQQTSPTVDPRAEEEEEREVMTKSVNLHRELATKRREVSLMLTSIDDLSN